MHAEVIRRNGALKIRIDGKIYEPLAFKSFRPTAKNISEFYNAGVMIFNILSSGIICRIGVPYSLYGESWIDDNTYDFNVIDAQIELFLANAPDAYFSLMIQVDTREWYCKKHGVPYSFTHLSQVIADKSWREAAEDYLRAAVRHVEEKYGERIYGYFILGGMTTEWFSEDDFEESHPIKREAFRKYAGDPNAEIPTYERRELPSSELFIDPLSEKSLVEYRRFHSELISSTICSFAHVVKEETDRKKLCGVYYGYLFELFGPRLWNTGALDYERVFTCPDIDMISSPSSYLNRRYDDMSSGMVTSDTLDRHNKLYFLEFDHITHLAPFLVPGGNGIEIPGSEAKFENETQTVDVMRRDFMLCQARRMALWWFDMFEGWFYSKGMMNEISGFVKISKRLAELDMSSASEICVIAEGAASLYFINKNAHYNTEVLSDQRNGLAGMGAPYDIHSICDLERIDCDRYKLFIFLDQFKISEENERVISERIKSQGKTLLWFGAPGVITERGIEHGRLCEITGIKCEYMKSITHRAEAYGAKYGSGKAVEGFVVTDHNAEIIAKDENGNGVLAIKECGGVRSIFASFGDLPRKVLREFARLAGVHIYTDSCPVYVNCSMIGVYMDKKEDLIITVKEDGAYEDMFTGNVYLSDNLKLHLPRGKYRSVLLVKMKTEEKKKRYENYRHKNICC